MILGSGHLALTLMIVFKSFETLLVFNISSQWTFFGSNTCIYYIVSDQSQMKPTDVYRKSVETYPSKYKTGKLTIL